MRAILVVLVGALCGCAKAQPLSGAAMGLAVTQAVQQTPAAQANVVAAPAKPAPTKPGPAPKVVSLGGTARASSSTGTK